MEEQTIDVAARIRKWLGCSVLIGAVIIALVFVLLSRVDQLLVGRGAYAEMPVDEIPAECMDDFRSLDHKEARLCMESSATYLWTESRSYDMWKDRAVIILGWRYRGADSIAKRQVRVELQRNGESWDVVWVGQRWRCKAGRGDGWGWSKKLCS